MREQILPTYTVFITSCLSEVPPYKAYSENLLIVVFLEWSEHCSSHQLERRISLLIFLGSFKRKNLKPSFLYVPVTGNIFSTGRVWKWWNQNCIYLGFFPNWGCLSFWVSISWETLEWLENGNKSLADWDFANIQKPALGRILLLNLNGPKCYLFRCGDLHLITATYNYSPSVTFFFFFKENP